MTVRFRLPAGRPTSGRSIGFWSRAGVAGAGAAAIAGGALIGAAGHDPVGANPTHAAPNASSPHVALAAAALNQYWLVAADGGIFPFGGAGGFGSEGYHPLNQPIVGIAGTPTGQGYWMVAADGGIFPHGDAAGLGSEGGTHLNKPIVGMAATPSGQGYMMVASDGGIFPHGDAPQGLGSEGGTHLNQPIVGMAMTPDNGGYWLVAADGGIFPHGDAPGLGSEGGTHLNQPIVGMVATATGKGYMLVASDGGLFPFGDAPQGLGSTGGMHLNKPIVGMALTQDGGGYWLVASDGGIFPFGHAVGSGSLGGTHLNQPIVGMAVPRTVIGTHELLAAPVNSLPADGVTQTVFTATVLDSTDTPVPGDTLTFSVSGAGCGSVSPTRAVTGYDGTATTTYTASTSLATCTVHGVESFGPVGNAKTIAQIAGGASHIAASPGSGSYTADQGADTTNLGIVATFTVTDAQGHVAPNVPLDLSTSLAHASIPLNGMTNSSGVLAINVTDTTAGDVGTVTAAVQGTTVQGSTGTLTITPGAFAKLGQPTVGSQVAGTQYTVPVSASDAHDNPVNPSTAGFTFSGTALANPTSNGPTPAPAFEGPFSGGNAILDVTSLKAGSVQLTITDGAVPITTAAYTVAPAVSKTVTTSVTTPPTVDADAASSSTGIPVSFTVLDKYGNHEAAGVGVTLSTTLAHATLTPSGSVLTDGTGTVSTVVKDAVAENGTVTGTVGSVPTATITTPTITITAGRFATMTLAGPASAPTVGQSYSLTLAATDNEGNAVNPTSGITLSGTAKDIAPDNNPNHTGSASLGTFSNGMATVTVTSYRSGSANLTATYTSGSTTFPSNTDAYTVNPGAYASIVPSYVDSAPTVALDAGPTPTLVIVQPPTGSSLPTGIVVHLATADAYQNKLTTSSDAVTTSLAPDTTTTPDSGSLAGGVPPTPDSVSGAAVTITAAGTFSSGASQFTYTPPATIPASGAGNITITDSQNPTPVTETMHVVVTKVAHLQVVSTLNCSSGCVAGDPDKITYQAQDANGNAVGNAWIDLSKQGLANATVSPSSPAQTNPNGPSTGQLTVTLTDNKAPETGTLTAGLHDVAGTDLNLVLVSTTISYSVGTPTDLWISTSNAPGGYNAGSPASETAGVPYTLYVWSLDAHQNPANPTGNVTVTGTALASLGSSASSSSLSTFSGGLATLQVTSAKVNASAALTPGAPCGGGACTAHGVSFPINVGAPALVTASLTPTGPSFTADEGHTGIAVGFTVTDSEGNPTSNIQLNVTKSNTLTGNLSAPTATTNASGVAGVTLTDTHATDTGTVTGTVSTDSTVFGSTSAFTITAGFIHTLAFGSSATQVAGTSYSITVIAQDTYSNPVNPAWSALTLSGSALSASPNPSITSALHNEAGAAAKFSNGVSTVTITSYLAQGAGPTNSIHQLTVVCSSSNTTVCEGSHPGSNADFAINAAAPSQIVVRDSNGNVPSTVVISSASQVVSLTVKREDPYNNAVSSQTGTVRITLSPGTHADNGLLSGGGVPTAPDTAGAVHIDLLLSSATSFSYTAPPALPGNGTGALTYVDLTSGATSNPAQTTITD